MAVLHHAFKCSIDSVVERELRNILEMWAVGESEKLSASAIESYAALSDRHDIHAAFHLAPEGGVQSWLQPEFISPGLASFVRLASHFQPLPSLSASYDTNHALLAKCLPEMGWSSADTQLLITGRPIEVMLERFSLSRQQFIAGGFAHTGGWTPPEDIGALRARIETLLAEPSSDGSDDVHTARGMLDSHAALDDAAAMLKSLRAGDWLITSITH